MDIAKRIKAFRIQYGYTQVYVADKIGVTRVTISNWEKGNTLPDILNIMSLCELYNTSLDNFMREGGISVIKEVKPKAYSSPLLVSYGSGFHTKTAQVKATVDLETGELRFFVGNDDVEKIKSVDQNKK